MEEEGASKVRVVVTGRFAAAITTVVACMEERESHYRPAAVIKDSRNSGNIRDKVVAWRDSPPLLDCSCCRLNDCVCQTF